MLIGKKKPYDTFISTKPIMGRHEERAKLKMQRIQMTAEFKSEPAELVMDGSA